MPWTEIFDDIMGSTEEIEEGDELPISDDFERLQRRLSAMRVASFWNHTPRVFSTMFSVLFWNALV